MADQESDDQMADRLRDEDVTPEERRMVVNRHGCLLQLPDGVGLLKWHGAQLTTTSWSAGQLRTAALGERSMLLATESRVFCLPAGWSMELHGDETVEGVAMGSDWAAVLTSGQMLHLFSEGGAQQGVLCTPGAPVAMTGADDQLALFFHTAPTVRSQQTLSAQAFRVQSGGATVQAIVTTPVPLRRQRHIQWSGFTESANLAFADSAGAVFILRSGAYWVQVAARGCMQIIDVSEAQQLIRILPESAPLLPFSSPFTEVPFSLPFLSTSSSPEPFVEPGVDASWEQQAARVPQVCQPDSPAAERATDAAVLEAHTLLDEIWGSGTRLDARAAQVAEAGALVYEETPMALRVASSEPLPEVEQSSAQLEPEPSAGPVAGMKRKKRRHRRRRYRKLQASVSSEQQEDMAEAAATRCPECQQDPCIVQQGCVPLPNSQKPLARNAQRRKSFYKKFWSALNRAGLWSDPAYMSAKLAAPGPSVRRLEREIMPECVIRCLRRLLPNPPEKAYLGHKWQ
ncbi:uncharacterized protein LOC144110270 [Amblyomma americanum]